MTRDEFERGLSGDVTPVGENGERLCYLVAEGLERRAGACRMQKKTVEAKRLVYMASQLNARGAITKRLRESMAAEIENVCRELVTS